MHVCPYCGQKTVNREGHYNCLLAAGFFDKKPRVTEVKVKITQIAGPIWKAQSESNEDKWYDIDMDVPFCKCPAMVIQPNTLRKNGRIEEADNYLCKHIKAIAKKTGQIVGPPDMDAEEKAAVAARKANILSKFVDREPSVQERALREALDREAATRRPL